MHCYSLLLSCFQDYSPNSFVLCKAQVKGVEQEFDGEEEEGTSSGPVE